MTSTLYTNMREGYVHMHTRGETASVKQSMRRYYWAFTPAIVLYTIGTMLLFVSEGRSWGIQLAMAAVPIVGVVWVAVALYGLYRRSDELVRWQMVKGAASGFLVGMPALAISGLIFSFLDEPPGRPTLLAVWIPFLIAAMGWSIGWARAQKTGA
ncbi:MAG: hypothetical protein KJN81_09660 [Acidimicrobiia bacterium]|nr:hypothetical protein [Acidimicrobiia bacterium]NNL28679.1 hypothetical protein [Acidimicrobiia bacterium]